ncbi:MAG: LysM peptidoglycan-binding domain-containing protein [Nitrospirae bacterium]|nr:LysM peptidoglycan-binding domain-containing protein [Nitrospirota bacterium]
MRKLYAVLSFILLLTLLATAGYANTTYTVKKGDTLRKVAKKYNTSLSDIKHANNLKSGRLRAGMKLSIPDGRSRKKREPVQKGAASERNGSSKRVSAEKSLRDGEGAHHLVRKGDTLKIIARKYSLTVNELKRMNNLGKGRLKVGQQLLVRNPEPRTYTVKKGDSLKKVARKFRVSIDELKEINGLKDNSLKPGQKILLAKKRPEPKDAPDALSASYNRKLTPVITSEKLEEVKELSKADDILSELSMKERLILFAKKMLHLPYRFGGTGAFGLDCSAYVQKAYGFIGQTLPRSAREQFRMGESVEKKDLLTGDLVFFKTYASFPSHVGIYLGNNLFIHASSLSKKVTIDSLESPYYFKRFIGAKRLIPEEDMEAEEVIEKEN